MTFRAFAGKGLASPSRIAVVDASVLIRWGLESQSQIMLSSAEVHELVWVYPSKGDVREAADLTASIVDTLPENLKSTEMILLSKRARDAFGEHGPVEVTVTVPKTVRLNVAPALIHDLPRGDEVQLPDAIARLLVNGCGWGLLVHEGCSVPVRLRTRPMSQQRVRLSMLTRTLLSTPDAQPIQNVQLSALLHTPWPVFYAPVRRLRGLVNRLFELLLRPLLGSTRVVLRTTQALVGDDSEQVARLHTGVFPLLGIKPGDHIIVTWAKRQAFAIALETEDITEQQSQALRTLQMVNLFVHGDNKIAIDHLAIGLSATLRAELGIPPRTAVMVRRRLGTVFVGQLNQLVLPVCGLAIAATKFSNIPRVAWVLGFVLVLFVGMFPARHRKPPRGRLS